MNRKLLYVLSVLSLLCFRSVGQQSKSSQKEYEIAAYYFPNYHPDSINERWHGKGWTEWDVLKAAKPRFPGHEQPKIPSMATT